MVIRDIKLIFSLFIMSSTIFGLNAQESGIEFFKGSFQEALDKAKTEDKLIFMDAFTTWCGPCRRMSSNVFPDPAVGDFYNQNFINLKVDMEKGEGPTLSGKYSVASYPTLLYIDFNGKIVHRSSGGRPPEAFIELGKEALKKQGRAEDFEKMYNEGKRDPKTVLNYIRALNRSDKSSLKVANDYLASQPDLSTKENIDIITEAATEADSKIFDYLIQYKNEIIRDKTLTVFQTKVYNCCQKTFKKSLEYRNIELLKEAQAKMKYFLEKQQLFTLQTNVQYYSETGEAKSFVKSAKTYVSKIAKNDATKLYETAQTALKYFKGNTMVMSAAEKWSKKAMENGGQAHQYLNYALILDENKKRAKAIEILKMAKTLPCDKPEVIGTIDYLLNDYQK